MKLIYRIAYYLGGFTIGLILLFFFLGGKKASCDYSPNARTLKNIRNKERVFSKKAIYELTKNQLDTSSISTLLRDGDVLFSESNTQLDSCKQYVIQGAVLEKNMKIFVENCEVTATITDIQIQKK